MIKKTLILSPVLLMCILAFAPKKEHQVNWTGDTPLSTVMFELGVEKPSHWIDGITPEMIKQGEDLFRVGRTTLENGKNSKYISQYYVCTHCHNNVVEDPVLTDPTPEARLSYAVENELPFLQATTMYGTVDRSSWYNGDYHLKYGSLVEDARYNLAGAIQLCAQECSQGRELEDWEVQSLIAYFWSLEYTLADLGLTNDNIHDLAVKAMDESAHEELRDELVALYTPASPATFGEVPEDKKQGYGLVGNASNGQHLYELSCLHCHYDHDVSAFVLDNGKMSFRFLKSNINRSSNYSLYEVVRIGTKAVPGHKPYMPHYTLERMSDQQLEDLRAYIEERATS